MRRTSAWLVAAHEGYMSRVRGMRPRQLLAVLAEGLENARTDTQREWRSAVQSNALGHPAVYRANVRSGGAPMSSGRRAFDNQHVVSQAILRQWIDAEPKLVEVYLRESGLTTLAPTSEVCAIQNFIHDDPARVEHAWGSHETRLGDFYRALTKEGFFGDPRAVQTARTMLALHAARSYTMGDVSALARAAAKEQTAHELVAKYPHELIAAIHSRTLLFIPITYAVLLDEARRAVERNSGPMVPGGAFFRDRLVTHFRRARQLMKAQPGLEVLVPANPSSEFVVGDDPVLIPSAEMDGRFGPRHGVGWLEAKTFVMPFSPRHVIAVGPTDVWHEVSDDVVTWVNLHQLRQSRRHLVTRRGSGLAHWAADVIRAAAAESAA